MGLRIGVIGGSGLYEMEGMTEVQEVKVETPYGDPSDAFVVGKLGDVELVFLSRHGRGHRYNPSEVPYRANLFGMKKLGVNWVISVSAVGSLRAEIAPRDVVLVDHPLIEPSRAPPLFLKGASWGTSVLGIRFAKP